MLFNLIVTHEPGPDNPRFIYNTLREKISDLVLVDSGPAVMLFKTKDPYEAIKILKRHRDQLTMIYRIIPVDLTTEAYVEDVAEKASELALKRIPPGRTYRIVLHGRLYWRETRAPAHSMDAISVIAEKIDRKVSLTKPDYLVYIRSLRLYRIRRVAAITVTTPDNIISLASGKP